MRVSEKRLKKSNFWNILENIKHKEETVIMDREILGIDHGLVNLIHFHRFYLLYMSSVSYTHLDVYKRQSKGGDEQLLGLDNYA